MPALKMRVSLEDELADIFVNETSLIIPSRGLNDKGIAEERKRVCQGFQMRKLWKKGLFSRPASTVSRLFTTFHRDTSHFSSGNELDSLQEVTKLLGLTPRCMTGHGSNELISVPQNVMLSCPQSRSNREI